MIAPMLHRRPSYFEREAKRHRKKWARAERSYRRGRITKAERIRRQSTAYAILHRPLWNTI